MGTFDSDISFYKVCEVINQPRHSSFFLRCDKLSELTCASFQRNSYSLRVRLVAVKRFPENTYFLEMLISGKGKCFPLFGCLGNRFPENQFRCLVRPNILRKLFYGKSFPVFGLWIIFTQNMKCVTNSSTCIIYTTL